MHGVPGGATTTNILFLFGIIWGDPEASCPGELTPRPYETISPEPGRGEPDLPGVRDAGRRGAKVAPFPGRGPANRKEGNRSPASGGVGC